MGAVHGAASCTLAPAGVTTRQARRRGPGARALRAGNALQMKLPKVDLGSLEEVLGRMEADLAGEWDDVFFVPAGTMTPTAK